jgi:hypothetical protein
MMGIGMETCSQVGSQLSNRATELAMMSWVQGYTSGRNVQSMERSERI